MTDEQVTELVRSVDTFLLNLAEESELDPMELASLVVSRLALINKTYGNVKDFAEFLALVSVNLE